MENKSDTMTFKDTIKNYLYALKLAGKLYLFKFTVNLLLDVVQRAIVFFSFTYLLRYIVNGIQNKTPALNLIVYVLTMLILNIVFAIINEAYSSILEPIIERKSSARLTKEIYIKSLEADYANFENVESYEKYNRVLSNSVGALNDAMASVREAVGLAISLALNIWLVLSIDPFLMVFAIPPLIITFFTPKLQKIYYDYSVAEQVINRKSDYTRRTFYQAEFAKEMRLTNIHKVMIARFESSIKDYIHLLRTKGLKNALISYSLSFISSIVAPFSAQMYALYRALVSKTIMYGDCLVAINTLSVFTSIISSINVIISYICNSSLYIQDYRQFMTEEPTVNPNRNGLEPISGDIELCNVSFRYNGATEDTLRDVSLKIKKGEKIAIVGHNGAGKTTLVKLLLRLYDPTEGKICMSGHDIREYKLKEYRNTYGVLFQDYKLMSVTVAENVLGRVYRQGDDAIVIDSLKKADVWENISAQPKGIHTVMTCEFDDDGLILSGGQTQKLAIASIYARNADTVILDEPSSALDPLAEHEMYRNMLEASHGKTVIFISHRLSSAVSADRIFFMEEGRLAEQGSHAELMRLNGKYAEMFRMQAQNYTDEINEGISHE